MSLQPGETGYSHNFKQKEKTDPPSDTEKMVIQLMCKFLVYNHRPSLQLQ